MKRRFNIGDIIRGNEHNRYNRTNANCDCEVIEYIREYDSPFLEDIYDIKVKIINGDFKGEVWPVSAWKFDIVQLNVMGMNLDAWEEFMK